MSSQNGERTERFSTRIFPTVFHRQTFWGNVLKSALLIPMHTQYITPLYSRFRSYLTQVCKINITSYMFRMTKTFWFQVKRVYLRKLVYRLFSGTGDNSGINLVKTLKIIAEQFEIKHDVIYCIE